MGFIKEAALLLCLAAVASAGADKEANATGINCEDGLMIPLWPGTDHMSLGDRYHITNT
jgi:hypothetical protein